MVIRQSFAPSFNLEEFILPEDSPAGQGCGQGGSELSNVGESLPDT